MASKKESLLFEKYPVHCGALLSNCWQQDKISGLPLPIKDLGFLQLHDPRQIKLISNQGL